MLEVSPRFILERYPEKSLTHVLSNTFFLRLAAAQTSLGWWMVVGVFFGREGGVGHAKHVEQDGLEPSNEAPTVIPTPFRKSRE